MSVDISLTLFAIFAFVAIGLCLTMLILIARAKLVSKALCKILINDNPALTKEVEGGGTLLATLSSCGIAIPSPCGGKATCKQCKVQVIKGGGEILETDKATFSHKELLDGWRLSCQCKVKENLSLKLDEKKLSMHKYVGQVISNDNVATFIKEIAIEIKESPHYQPGDYLQIHVPPFKTNTTDWKKTMRPLYYGDWEKFDLFNKDIVYEGDELIRAYSMASYPLEGSLFKFNVRIATPPFEKGKMLDVPWGICSSYLFSLKPGDRVTLSGPFGESHMIHDQRPLFFLIGGAGSSFGRSHILDLFLSKNTKRHVDLWYGARSLKENIYQKDFEALAKKFPNFSYHLVLSEPLKEEIEAGWPKDDPVRTNFLFKAFKVGMLDHLDEPENGLYYVCGPPLHNSSVMKLLDQYGVERESIVLDDFGS